MEVKKSEKASLENKRLLFTEIGFVVALIAIYFAFNWSSTEKEVATLETEVANVEVEDMVPITQETPPPPEAAPKIPILSDQIDVVDDNIKVDDNMFQNLEDDANSGVEIMDYIESAPEEETVEEEAIPFQLVDEKNSALTGQILWSGFKTDVVYYTRLARTIGSSKWTLKKKIRLVKDTLFSFSTVPVTIVETIGMISFIGSLIWALVVIICKICGAIAVSGWTMLFIFNLFSFGVIMLTLGILGEYLWRSFDASRKRPPYIVEEENKTEKGE